MCLYKKQTSGKHEWCLLFQLLMGIPAHLDHTLQHRLWRHLGKRVRLTHKLSFTFPHTFSVTAVKLHKWATPSWDRFPVAFFQTLLRLSNGENSISLKLAINSSFAYWSTAGKGNVGENGVQYRQTYTHTVIKCNFRSPTYIPMPDNFSLATPTKVW